MGTYAESHGLHESQVLGGRGPVVLPEFDDVRPVVRHTDRRSRCTHPPHKHRKGELAWMDRWCSSTRPCGPPRRLRPGDRCPHRCTSCTPSRPTSGTARPAPVSRAQGRRRGEGKADFVAGPCVVRVSVEGADAPVGGVGGHRDVLLARFAALPLRLQSTRHQSKSTHSQRIPGIFRRLQGGSRTRCRRLRRRPVKSQHARVRSERGRNKEMGTL